MRIVALLSVLGMLAWGKCFAKGTIIIQLDIPGLHQADEMGSYDLIIKEAFSASQSPLKMQLYPLSRGEKAFKHCFNCCLSPMNNNPEFYLPQVGVVETEAMNVAKVYAFSARGQTVYSSLESLKGKTVGLRKGMPYGKSVAAADLDWIYVRELKKHLILLDKGRIDVFLAYVPDAYLMFAENNMAPLPHDRANPIAVHADALLCRGVPTSVIRGFNAAIRQMKKDGRMQKILGDSFIPE